jgi:hypothetical protein
MVLDRNHSLEAAPRIEPHPSAIPEADGVPAGLPSPPSQSRAVLQRPMLWSRKLATPIVLKDGRTIATLGQA